MRDENDMEVQKRSYELEIKVVRMHSADVHFMAGTDAEIFYPGGFGLHAELAFFVGAGFSPLEALKTATLNPALFLGRTADFARGRSREDCRLGAPGS
jgi:imidazolonepropionase-like amidohydrolase